MTMLVLSSEGAKLGVIEAEREAAKLLETSWGSRLPVDPFQLAKGLGIVVSFEPMPSDVSGRIEIAPGSAPHIWINSNDGQSRQRFTCAHEIGHYLNRSDGDQTEIFTDWRDTLAGLGTDEKEIFANQFAAALLMPAHEVASFHERQFTAEEMARQFATSTQAMEIRLRNLRLV
jgi:IrrE N-terminal-like domain